MLSAVPRLAFCAGRRFFAYDGAAVQPVLELGSAPISDVWGFARHGDRVHAAGNGHPQLMSAVASHDGTEWTLTGRAQLPGEMNGFLSLASATDGLFVTGTSFQPPPAACVLRLADERWIADLLPVRVTGTYAHLQSANGVRVGGRGADVWAIVAQEAIALRRDGAWHDAGPLPTAPVVDAWCGDGCVVAVGAEGRVAHFDGRTWRFEPIFAQGRGLCITGTAPDDLFLVGTTRTSGYLARFDGKRWQDLEIAGRPTGIAMFERGHAVFFNPPGLYRTTDAKSARIKNPTKAAVMCFGYL